MVTAAGMTCPGWFGEHLGHEIAGHLLRAADLPKSKDQEAKEMLFVGDDWAEDHHDVELVDEAGTVLARRRLPEGQSGVTRLHSLIAEHLPDPGGDADPSPPVVVGIETEPGQRWTGNGREAVMTNRGL